MKRERTWIDKMTEIITQGTVNTETRTGKIHPN